MKRKPRGEAAPRADVIEAAARLTRVTLARGSGPAHELAEQLMQHSVEYETTKYGASPKHTTWLSSQHATERGEPAGIGGSSRYSARKPELWRPLRSV